MECCPVYTAFGRRRDRAKKKAAFSSANPAPGIDYTRQAITAPPELQQLFSRNRKAALFFESLAFTHKREYVEWIIAAKKDETKKRRLAVTMEKLNAGKKNYNEA